MAEIKVGDKVRLTQDVKYSNHKKGDIGVVASYGNNISGLLRVRMEYNNTEGGTAPFEPGEIELVEELAPLKLEHLKVGQLVIRKSDGWQRFITDVDEDKISYLCGSKGENLTIEFNSLVTEFIGYYRLPDISEVAQFKKDNPVLFVEYVMPEEPVADAISPEEDAVNHPSHYTSDPSGVECIQITRHRNFNIGNAIKYLWRAGLKQSADKSAQEKQIEDLKKAVFYIQDEIKRLES